MPQDRPHGLKSLSGTRWNGPGVAVLRQVEGVGRVSFQGPMVLPLRSDGLGRIRTGDLRCVRATSSPLDHEPAGGPRGREP